MMQASREGIAIREEALNRALRELSASAGPPGPLAAIPEDPADRRRRLARELIGTSSEPFGVYLVGPRDPASELCRYVEAVVFGEVFGDTSKVLADEYGPYDEHSAFFLVVDHERLEPAGVMRIVLPSATGLKSLNDMEPVWGEKGEALARGLAGFDESRVWDIATLAVVREYRGGAAGGVVPLALYQALATSTLRLGVEWWVAILDVVVLDLLGAMSVPFHGFAGLEARKFLGSPASLPVWVSVAEADEAVRTKNPAFYPIAALGEPLRDVKGLDLDHLDALCPEPLLARAV